MEWLKGEKPNLGFIVAATSLGGDRVPITFSRRHDIGTTKETKSNKQPILVLFNHDSDMVDTMNPSPNLKIVSENKSSKNKKAKSIDDGQYGSEADDGNDQDNSAPILPNIPNSSKFIEFNGHGVAC